MFFLFLIESGSWDRSPSALGSLINGCKSKDMPFHHWLLPYSGRALNRKVFLGDEKLLYYFYWVCKYIEKKYKFWTPHLKYCIEFKMPHHPFLSTWHWSLAWNKFYILFFNMKAWPFPSDKLRSAQKYQKSYHGDNWLCCGRATSLFDIFLSLRKRIRKTLDCSPPGRERELNLNRV